MTRLTKVIVISVLGLICGCGESNQSVRPDEMSAEAHRQEAQKAAAASERELRAANAPLPPPNLTVSGGGNPERYYYDLNVYNARNEHLARAQQLSEHARQHEAAAASLEKFETAECKEFPPATRAACPFLGPVAQLTDLPNGVRVQMAAGVRSDAVLAHMRCHLAFAQARGFEAAASCPLYVKGIEIRPGSEPGTIEIMSTDAKVADQIRTRTREEAVLVRAALK